MKNKKTKVTEEQLKNMKGRTNWAKLVAEEKTLTKKSSRRKKREADFCVNTLGW